MRKKLFYTIFILSIFTSFSAYADGFNAYTPKTENKITKIEAPVEDGSYPVIIYTPDKTLYSVEIADFTNKEAVTDIIPPDSDYILKLYSQEDENSVYSLHSAEVKYLDTQSTFPEETLPDIPEENETDKEEPPVLEVPSLPGVYENERVANMAFAVVKSNEIKLNEHDETVSAITAYYQGREINFELHEDFTLSCKEESLTQFDGMSASALTEGDIIYLHCNLSGKILSADLLFRAPQSNIITSDDYDIVSKELTEYSCGFGLIAEKYSDRAVALYDSTGLERNSFLFDLHPETVVYYYDSDKRTNKLSIGTVADILESEIPEFEKDDDGNILVWNPENIYNYAYARIYDETICDVVIYANYTG